MTLVPSIVTAFINVFTPIRHMTIIRDGALETFQTFTFKTSWCILALILGIRKFIIKHFTREDNSAPEWWKYRDSLEENDNYVMLQFGQSSHSFSLHIRQYLEFMIYIWLLYPVNEPLSLVSGLSTAEVLPVQSSPSYP